MQLLRAFSLLVQEQLCESIDANREAKDWVVSDNGMAGGIVAQFIIAATQAATVAYFRCDLRFDERGRVFVRLHRGQLTALGTVSGAEVWLGHNRSWWNFEQAQAIDPADPASAQVLVQLILEMICCDLKLRPWPLNSEINADRTPGHTILLQKEIVE